MPERNGRNDPCPCGSGKKYKRCCLGKEAPRPLRTEVELPKPRAQAPRMKGSLAGFQPEPRRSEWPRTEWDDWYDGYEAAGQAEKLSMVRALILDESRTAEFFEGMDFVGLVLDLERDLGPEGVAGYLAFLEEMCAVRPEVFKLRAGYFVRDMAYAYLKLGRERDIEGPLQSLLGDDARPGEPTFDLLDLLRLAGLYNQARALAFAAVREASRTDLVPWAIQELVEIAPFFMAQEFLDAGGSADGLPALLQRLAEIKCDTDQARLTTILAHRAGKAGRTFQLGELVGPDETAGFNLYLLLLDFGRWLAIERPMSPVVAEAMRFFAYAWLTESWEDTCRNPLVLDQQRLDRYLAGLLGLMSLHQLRGVATLIAVRHFQDFLASIGLLDEGEHRRAKRICDGLWSQLQRALGNLAPSYAFLNRYL